jgi:hypothetical protein
VTAAVRSTASKASHESGPREMESRCYSQTPPRNDHLSSPSGSVPQTKQKTFSRDYFDSFPKPWLALTAETRPLRARTYILSTNIRQTGCLDAALWGLFVTPTRDAESRVCRLCFILRAALLCWFPLSFTACFGLHGHLQVSRILYFQMPEGFCFAASFHTLYVSICVFPVLFSFVMFVCL